MRKVKTSRTIAGLRYPALASIKGRSSTIRSEFIKSVIPEILPSQKELEESLKILQQKTDKLHCAYCGDNASEWDHFFAAVFEKEATGYITEVYNLVPACGKCNQSKGGKYWKTWIRGTKAKRSPTYRVNHGTSNITQAQLEKNIERLEAFEEWGRNKITKLDFKSISEKNFKEYFDSCEALIDTFAEYEQKAIELKIEVESFLKKKAAQK